MTEVEKKDHQASDDQAVEKKDQDAAADQKVEIDYKAELERVTAERDNYKTGMLNAKDQLKKKQSVKKEDGEDAVAAEEDSEESKIAEIVRKELEPLKQSLELNTFESLVSEYSNDPNEQALIKYHFENSVGPVGTIRERIENAKLIANKKAIFKENSEMKRALESKAGISHAPLSAGGNIDAEKSSGREFFSPEQVAALKKRGLDPKKVEENYRKKQQASR